MNDKFDWSNHEAVKKAVRRWLESQRAVDVLPVKSWLNPLNIDVLIRRPCPEELYLFELYEIKTRRKDLQRGPYQLETCRIRLADRGATRCYIAMPHGLIEWLDHAGEYPFFIVAMKRFGFGIVSVSPGLVSTIYLKAKTFKREKEAKWK